MKSTEQYFSTEGEDMAVIYENIKAEQENFNLTDEEAEVILDVIGCSKYDNKQQTD